MIHRIVTECPACTTRFQVTDGQLKIASGKVRCGSCLEVFNAQLYRCDDISDPVTSVSISADATPEQPFEQFEVAEFIPPRRRSSSSPEQKHNEAGDYSEKQINPEHQAVATNPDETEKTEHSASLFRDESLTEQVKADYDTEPATAIDLNKPVQELFLETLTGQATTGQADVSADPALSSPSLTENPEVTINARDSSATEHASPSEPTLMQTQNELNNPEQRLQQRSPVNSILSEPVMINSTRRKPAASIGWSLLSLLTLLALMAQFLWFERISLRQQPMLTPFYSQLCQRAPCNMPLQREISSISTQQLIVQQHPEYQGALNISVLLENAAGFEQPYPAIKLSFSDRKGELISQRKFQPDDYLSSSVIDPLKMPVNQSVQVRLEILDPGRRAVSYQAELLPSNSLTP
ncbi:DUF3426 domain-containing protein [Amphritea sp. HPY]|uniref:DUF3426 domain-containing protein n=1 Tax=Amphritea sp. HPY TaxID=3421652 RepID=UPI003D7C659A